MNIIEIDDSYAIVEFFPYRSAKVANWEIKSTLSPADHLRIKKWIEDQGFKLDNHSTWITSTGMSYQYSDRTLYIGTTVEVVNW